MMRPDEVPQRAAQGHMPSLPAEDAALSNDKGREATAGSGRVSADPTRNPDAAGRDVLREAGIEYIDRGVRVEVNRADVERLVRRVGGAEAASASDPARNPDAAVLPCPFCGTAPLLSANRQEAYCYTPKCAARGREIPVERWQVRAPVPKPAGRVPSDEAHAAGILAAANVMRHADLNEDAWETVAERAVEAYRAAGNTGEVPASVVENARLVVGNKVVCGRSDCFGCNPDRPQGFYCETNGTRVAISALLAERSDATNPPNAAASPSPVSGSPAENDVAASAGTSPATPTLRDVLQEVVRRHPCGPMTRLGHGVAAAHYRCSVCGFHASGPDSVIPETPHDVINEHVASLRFAIDTLLGSGHDRKQYVVRDLESVVRFLDSRRTPRRHSNGDTK